MVAGTTARCLTTSIRTVLTELVLFRTSAFARILPSCRICQKTVRLGGKFRTCKNYSWIFPKRFFFQQENQPWLICLSCLHSALSGPSGSNEGVSCTFFPSGTCSLTCEPTCTRPKLSPVRKKTWKLKNAEAIYIQKTQELFNKGVSKQNKSHRQNESHRPLSKTGLWPC